MSKKVLTNAKRKRIVATVPRLERVPCKLNNEEKTKAPESDVLTNVEKGDHAGLSQLPAGEQKF